MSPPVGNLNPSNTKFLGPTGVSLLNEISIGSAIFAQLTPVPTTQIYVQATLLATSVAIGRIYAQRADDVV